MSDGVGDVSVFVSPSAPLIGYDVLDDRRDDEEDDASLLPEVTVTSPDTFFDRFSIRQPSFVTAHEWMSEDQTIAGESLECALEDAYKYFIVRGFYRGLALDLGQIAIWTWLVLFFVFLGSCVDYSAIISLQAPTSLWMFVTFSNFGRGWFFVLSLVLFGLWLCWRLVKLVHETRRMWKMRAFYRKHLGLGDFDLRSVLWSEVLSRLERVLRDKWAPLSAAQIVKTITARDNWFKRLLHHVDFVFSIPVVNTEVSMLTRGLQWNMTYCIVNFFFGYDQRLRRDLTDASPIYRQVLADQLSKRVLIVTVLNIVLMPFIVIFVALYALFRYGEEFYKNPSGIVARQWSLSARWYFRDDNEMPHVLEERLRVSTKYASKYLDQFSSGPIEGISRAVAFMVGSIVMIMMALSVLNERTLLMLMVVPGKALLWWITILSAVWVFCRGLLKERNVFYPTEALDVVLSVVRRLPVNFVSNAGSSLVLDQFRQLFPLRVTLMLLEFAGVVMTPWILFYRVRPKCRAIVDLFCEGLTPVASRPDGSDGSNGSDGKSPVNVDTFDLSILQSAKIIEHLQRVDSVL